MTPEELAKIRTYVSQNIDQFHSRRIEKIQELKLLDVLRRKKPYIFRSKNITNGPDLIRSIMQAHISSSEESLFGGFLEDLAIYCSELTGGGQKSSATGIDLELTRDNIRYIIAIKSGNNWGNSDQHKKLRENLKKIKGTLLQSRHTLNVQPVLGICYGNFKTTNDGELLKIGGQSFWHFISGEPNLYIDIIDPLGYEAQKHNDTYQATLDLTINRFVRDFMIRFCLDTGEIDWPKLVQYNSGNLPPRS